MQEVLDAAISGALVAAILGGVSFLFQKSKTKRHAKIKFGIMLALEIILFPTIFAVFSMPGELIVITILTIISFGSFIGYNIYKTYLQIKNNTFKNDDNKNSFL